MKYLDLDDNVIKSSWRLTVYYFHVLYPLFRGGTTFANLGEEGPCYCQFGRGGPNLLAIWDRRSHFIGNSREEAKFY